MLGSFQSNGYERDEELERLNFLLACSLLESSAPSSIDLVSAG